ncbi:MAG: insulinase family protein [Coprobacter sp.]|nr:insulinase family protein [Coprobacter sp.]
MKKNNPEPLDRTRPPHITPPGRITLPRPRKSTLANGIPLYVIDTGDQDVNRLDVIITSGRYDEEKPHTADLTAAMLKEGAGGMTSGRIAEQLDYYGAWIKTSAMYHHTRITLWSLNRCFRETWHILAHLVWNPDFPAKEFSVLTARRRQHLLVEQEKVQYLAAKALYASLFGPEHPYGRTTGADHYDHIALTDLQQWHRRRYTPGNSILVLSGKVTPDMFGELDRLFGSRPAATETFPAAVPPPVTPEGPRENWIEKADALQSAVHIGRLVVQRDHPDFEGLRILNTLLGGYFGSRLMTTLREEKGYTYGIHSSLVGLQQAACLTISTQTDIRYTRPLIDGVFAEMERLRREPVGADELNQVRSYMAGELIRITDTPFTIADTCISMLLARLPFDHFDRQADAIRRMTPETLQQLAVRYLDPDAFHIAVAGHNTR